MTLRTCYLGIVLCAYHRFQHSYAVLLSASPDLQNADPEDKFAAWFSRQLGKLMKKENLVKLLPDLINDVSSFYQQLTINPTANGGMFDPFEEMNRLIFQLTMRTVGATEIAESPSLFSQSFKLVRQIGENSSTARIIIPWLPTWRYMKRMIAAMRLYMLINGFTRERTVTGRRENDALQLLLDDGESGTKVVEVSCAMPFSPWLQSTNDTTRLTNILLQKWIILAVLAGQLNSGWNAAWVFCFLAMDPHWMRKVRHEVDSAVVKHRTSSQQTPLDIFNEMSIDDWECDFPLINLCLHESIRIVTVGAGFRRNISSKDVKIGSTGEVIPKGAFAAFHIDQTHMNPEIYKDPNKFDPGRFLPGREEDKQVPLAYAGWGQGRHPCCESAASCPICCFPLG